jgi:antitoxin (DNA-binding transcriptional repressor) of toxin-antitoxin stability system
MTVAELFITGRGTLGRMKSVQLSELGALAEDVRNGEPVEVRDGERVVATVVPIREQTVEERIDELVRQGKARRGTGTVPEWFFTERPPKLGEGSALEEFLADRRKNDW